MRDHVKGFAEVQEDDICHTFSVDRCCHSIIEGPQIGQARSALDEAILAVWNHLFVSYVPKYSMIFIFYDIHSIRLIFYDSTVKGAHPFRCFDKTKLNNLNLHVKAQKHV